MSWCVLARTVSDERRSLAAIREHAKRVYVATLDAFAFVFLMHRISCVTMIELFIMSYFGWRPSRRETLDRYSAG